MVLPKWKDYVNLRQKNFPLKKIIMIKKLIVQQFKVSLDIPVWIHLYIEISVETICTLYEFSYSIKLYIFETISNYSWQITIAT